MTHSATTPAAGGVDENGLFPTGTPRRLIQRLEHATAGNLFDCEADLEEAVEIAAEEMAAALSAPSPAAGATGVVRKNKLQTIAATIRRWLEYDIAMRADEGLAFDDDTHLMAPPKWPSHGMLRKWIEVLETAPEAPTPVTSAPGAKGAVDTQKLRQLCGMLDDLSAWDHSKNLFAAVKILEAAR